MMSTDDRLVYMANQIARNLATHGPDAALEVADHIATFWDPRMRAHILAMTDPALGPIAADAVRLLRARGASPSRNAAAGFGGGSDAG